MSLTSNNFFNATRGVMGLFGQTNKAKKLDDEDGVEQSLTPEFESTLSDEEILQLTAKWEFDDASYQKDIKQQSKDNVNYWIGRQYNELQTAGTKKPLVDNLIFDSLETFLPIATRANPQAIVTGNGTPEGDKLAKTATSWLEHQAGSQNLRMKLKGVTRDWALHMIGCIKVGYDTVENDIETKKILPSRLIFDQNAEIDTNGYYYGEFLGERKKKTARKLAKMFPKKKAAIQAKCQGAWGTNITYVEWWTPTDVIFKMDSVILGKFKNPHWNYTGTTQVQNPDGTTREEEIVGINHFSRPMIPYLFLTIFTLGKRPHDETSLITQNIPLQDVINRRYQQIDKNVDSQNNGIVLSGQSFTKEQAAEAATQLARGNPLWVPSGPIENAYKRDQAPAISANVFQQLQDARTELRNIFGTSGSNAQALSSEKTVRGKIMVSQTDSTRIGGGITEYIEKLAEGVYNWYIQLAIVYYTDEHTFSIIGPKAQELMSFKNTDIHCKLRVTVKDGSLIPKDPLTKRNEAMDLWSAGAIAPIPLYTALDYPNPYESAKELLMWQLIQKGALPPQMMFPDFQAPQVPTGADQTNAVNPQEAQAEINPPQPDTVGQASKQILSSVKI